MTPAVLLVENILVCLLILVALRRAQSMAILALDNRDMYRIPFCRLLPAACGIVLAVSVFLQAQLAQTITFSNLWSLSGPFHESRLLVLLTDQAATMSFADLSGLRTSMDNPLVAAAYTIVLCLTLINVVIAVLGWRSLGAWRGIAVHVLSALITAAFVTLVTILLIWVVHWLNFWIFAVLLALVEMRRREERGVKLSF